MNITKKVASQNLHPKSPPKSPDAHNFFIYGPISKIFSPWYSARRPEQKSLAPLPPLINIGKPSQYSVPGQG